MISMFATGVTTVVGLTKFHKIIDSMTSCHLYESALYYYIFNEAFPCHVQNILTQITFQDYPAQTDAFKLTTAAFTINI